MVKHKVKLITLAFIFIYPTLIFSNDKTIKIDDYSYANGLKTSNTNYAFKDSKGFLWLCATDGIFRYDGYEFRNLNTIAKDTLNIKTHFITEDEDGNYWFGAMGNGLYFYNPGSERFFPLKLSIGRHANIFHILFLKDKIWLASNIGLLVIDKNVYDEETTVPARLLLPDTLNKVSQDNSINVLLNVPENDSILWVGSNGALYDLNTKTLKFNRINSYLQNSIRCISAHKKKTLIVGTWDGGIFGVSTTTYMVENDTFISGVNKVIGNARVKDVAFDDDDRFWVATYGEGLYVFEKDKFGNLIHNNYKNDIKKESLKSDLINRMFIDDTGIIWLCMNQPALSKIYFKQNNIRYFYPGKEDAVNEILSFSHSNNKDKFWVATVKSGIYLFNTLDHSTEQFTNAPDSKLKLHNNNISICFQDRNGNLWIADRHAGLFIVPAYEAIGLTNGEIKNNVLPIFANKLLLPNADGLYIIKFYEDSKGRVWIGTWESLYVVGMKEGFSNARNIDDLLSQSHVTCVYDNSKVEKANYPVEPVMSILEKNKDQFWLGTSGVGVVQLDEISEYEFSGKLLDLNKHLPGENITCLYKDKEQGIWIGTNSGLCYISGKTGKIKTITENNGLAAANINNIIEDNKSNIWISTSYGITKINPDDLTINNFFNTEKGKLNEYIPDACAFSSEGMLYFSSSEALAAIDPDFVKNIADSPPLYFTDIKIDNNKVVPNEKYSGTRVIESNINECATINVPYNHTLSIEFAALDYLSAEQLLYKYRIGSNKKWITLNSNQRSLILPAMSPGEYTLEIMLANLTKDNQAKSIRINYLPPFWRSKLSFFVYFAIFLILFLTYRKQTIQKIKQKSILEKERYERKKLEELNAMKSEFFSNISHEFRTPLSLIINPLEKHIKENVIPEGKKEKLNLALKSSYRLLKLTNELMDFSKIEKALLVPDYVLCDIVFLIDEICSHYFDLADTINIAFKVNCPFEQLKIPIDERMIEKVIFNLLSNAFKYTPENGLVSVNISKSHVHGTENVKFSVINTGEGIPKEVINKVFDKYYQVNNVQNKKMEGTGIGLALVKSYVELHHGLVEVRSEPGSETCFDIYLPTHQENYKLTHETENASNIELSSLQVSISEINTSKPSSHYSLLLVEDDDEIRNYITEELADDFKIVTAINGEEGLALACEVIPDLIVADIVMPVLSGIELCRKVKSQVLTSHIPLILLSAKATIHQQIEGLETGADVYIPKPFNLEHLRAQILRLLSFKETIYLRYLKENTLIPRESLNSGLDEEFMHKVIAFIEENLTNPNLTVEQLANYVTLSHAQTYRKVRAISGMPVVKFIRTVRLKKAAQLIAENQLNFTEIAYETGFSSLSYFTRCFHEHFGKSPSDFASGFNKD
jgi:signal transduction histidine kinase/ligand-binding sensor domain-containing protein/DNA-binding response OmpR family regulator